jgi:hypothetical protein
MNALLIAAASLTILVGLAHSVLGEKYILKRLFRRTELPHLFGSDWFTRRTLRFAWHLTTVAWWGFGMMLILLTGSSQLVSADVILMPIAGVFLLSAILAGVFTRGRHLSWVIFLVIGGVALYLATTGVRESENDRSPHSVLPGAGNPRSPA